MNTPVQINHSPAAALPNKPTCISRLWQPLECPQWVVRRHRAGAEP
jgi:hypothetical protein